MFMYHYYVSWANAMHSYSMDGFYESYVLLDTLDKCHEARHEIKKLYDIGPHDKFDMKSLTLVGNSET